MEKSKIISEFDGCDGAEPLFLVDGARGVYALQFFASVYGEYLCGVDPADLSILRYGPDSAEYWDAAQSVLDNGFFVDGRGRRWRAYQEDGDIFAELDR